MAWIYSMEFLVLQKISLQMLCTTNERRVYADGSIILQSAAIFKKFLTS